jgi:ribose transport system substrate-binding protein
MRTLRVCLASLSLLCASALGACGGDEDEPSGPSSSAGTSVAGECRPAGGDVAIVVHLQQPYTQNMIDGAEAAGATCNTGIRSAGPNTLDGPAQVKAFNDVISAGAKAVTVVAYPSNLWNRPISVAASRGIDVATMDVAAPRGNALVHVGPKEYDLGVMLAEAMVEKIGADQRGTIVLGICLPGTDVLVSRVNGFKDTVAERAPEIEVEGPIDVTADVGRNFAAWQRIQSSNREALGFAGVCEFDGTSLVRVKRQQPGDYVTGSIGNSAEVFQAVADGGLDFAISQNPFMMGYVSTRMLIENLSGQAEVPSGWLDTGGELITQENARRVKERDDSLREGPEGALRYFQDEIERIFADPEAAVRPLSAYLQE